MYHILPYTYEKARLLNVKIFPSKNPKYKIAVYDNNNKYITHVGSSNYFDFPTYIQERGLQYALNRRRLYQIRHENDRHKKGSRGYYADQLLW